MGVRRRRPADRPDRLGGRKDVLRTIRRKPASTTRSGVNDPSTEGSSCHVCSPGHWTRDVLPVPRNSTNLSGPCAPESVPSPGPVRPRPVRPRPTTHSQHGQRHPHYPSVTSQFPVSSRPPRHSPRLSVNLGVPVTHRPPRHRCPPTHRRTPLHSRQETALTASGNPPPSVHNLFLTHPPHRQDSVILSGQ